MWLDDDWGRSRGAGAATFYRLTDDQVREIRQQAADGESAESLAERFGVCRSHVLAILRRARRGGVK